MAIEQILTLQSGSLSPAILLNAHKTWAANRTDLGSTVRDFITTRAEIVSPHLSKPTLDLAGRFVNKVLTASPIPPVGLPSFIDGVLLSAESHGEIPLVLQGIACLNYATLDNNGVTENHVLEMTDKTLRWRRYIAEQQDFLIALNELGVRTLIVFGVSDILNFVGEETFALTPAVLRQKVAQNRRYMEEAMLGLNDVFLNIELPNSQLRPSFEVFSHSRLLKIEGEYRQQFDQNEAALSKQLQYGVREFITWLTTTFSHSQEYLNRLDASRSQTQITKMLALYATDHQIAEKIAQALFPHETISTPVISLCLQPKREPDWWITEKIACELLGIKVRQLVPFPNAGRWWTKPTPQAQFSYRSEVDNWWKLGPIQLFRTLMKKSDAEIIPEVETKDLTLEEIIASKQAAVQQTIDNLFGEGNAFQALGDFIQFRQRKQKIRS